ncbi:unnamed protein product [Mytilus coruscus]|uniref:Uncharacterized protein n=1 Tax=Mytilus coruscus TaxID=42192 RepID=A0A6J7ZU53_MYTCO|nr:unnamed protein product [Mytilus coruscus]
MSEKRGKTETGALSLESRWKEERGSPGTGKDGLGLTQTTNTLNLYLFQNGPRELSCKSCTLEVGSVVGVSDPSLTVPLRPTQTTNTLNLDLFQNGPRELSWPTQTTNTLNLDLFQNGPRELSCVFVAVYHESSYFIGDLETGRTYLQKDFLVYNQVACMVAVIGNYLKLSSTIHLSKSPELNGSPKTPIRKINSSTCLSYFYCSYCCFNSLSTIEWMVK